MDEKHHMPRIDQLVLSFNSASTQLQVQRLVTLRDLQGIEDLPPRGQTQARRGTTHFRLFFCARLVSWSGGLH